MAGQPPTAGSRKRLYQRMPARRPPAKTDAYRRQTYALPRDLARKMARDWFRRFPKAAYDTQVESWRVAEVGRIEFTMRGLPTAD